MNFNPGLLEVNGLWQGREDESLLYKFYRFCFTV